MLNQYDKLDDLILQALVQGEVEIPDEVLESIFQKEPDHRVPEEYSRVMVKWLQDFAKEKQAIKNKLEHPNLLNHFGEYLSIFMSAYSLGCRELAQIVEVNENQIEGLEKGKLSPTEIGIEKMVSLIKYVKLGWESARTLLYNAYKLYVIKPEVVEALARYDSKKKSNIDKRKSVLSAADELTLKVDMPEENEQEIQSYLTELHKVYEKNRRG